MHRDLKPQNILVAVDPVTERKQVSAELEPGFCVLLCGPVASPDCVQWSVAVENCRFWLCKALYRRGNEAVSPLHGRHPSLHGRQC